MGTTTTNAFPSSFARPFCSQSPSTNPRRVPLAVPRTGHIRSVIRCGAADGGGINPSDDPLRSTERTERRRHVVLAGLWGLAGAALGRAPALAGPAPPPSPSTSQTAAERIEGQAAAEFPLTLSSAATAVVRRPKRSRSAEEKAAEEEVLVVGGIELEPGQFAKFDVLVNAPDPAGVTPLAAEFAGSFTNVPHSYKRKERVRPMRTNLTLGLSALLEEIGADGDDSVAVTLVPRSGAGKVRIGGISIGYLKIR